MAVSFLSCLKTVWLNAAHLKKQTSKPHLRLSSRVLIEKMMSSSTGDGSSSAAGSGDYINIKETAPPGWACC